jgi:hypothetical protein
MPFNFWILIGLILLGACWIALHLMLLRRAANANRLPLPFRALAVVPPVAPVVAWVAGSRLIVVAWVLAGLGYLLLWLLGLRSA